MKTLPRSLTLALTAALLAGTLSACGGPGFSKPMRFGDRVVEPATLERGRDVYNRFCATCHGFDGKADTPQARQLDPRPRDFTHAEFKRVASPGALPTDAELAALITHGIPGTGMPAWPQLQGDDLDSVVQYLKTFSQRWQSESQGAPKKGPDGALNVLPAGHDAASFRAASGAPSANGGEQPPGSPHDGPKGPVAARVPHPNDGVRAMDSSVLRSQESR